MTTQVYDHVKLRTAAFAALDTQVQALNIIARHGASDATAYENLAVIIHKLQQIQAAFGAAEVLETTRARR